MSEPESIVFVVDDDPSVRSAIKRLIGSMGLQVELFASAQEFLASKLPNVPSCLVLDIRLPGISGLNLQRQLAKANIQIPIIFITAHGDITMTVRIQLALERDRNRRQQEAELAVLRDRFDSLSPREREVVALVVSGMLNKQIAAQIGAAENTVKVHRSRAMEKMNATSLADLIEMILRLQVPPVEPVN
jgi:RNA polymerase sigma factor (sigma-70 family)